MLYIEQASAGSGKTYMLAKIYIRNLLGEKPKGGTRYVLRNDDSLRQAHSRILAVTFTNKATNEMKLRIVDKLHALAVYKPGSGGKKPDYLDDFVKLFGVEEQAIVLQAQKALNYLLHGYADFHVSTIDSFFQMIMRSFVAEIDELSDNYQIEIDEEMVSNRAVDATMTQFREKDTSRSDTIRLDKWVKMVIDRNFARGGQWDPFRTDSIRGSLKSFAQLAAKEAFIGRQNELDEYFDKYGDNFSELYVKLMEASDKDCKEAHERMVQAYNKLKGLNGYDELHKSRGGKGVKGTAPLLNSVVSALKWPSVPEFKITDELQAVVDEGASIFTARQNKDGKLDAQYPGLTQAFGDMLKAAIEWQQLFTLWRINTQQLPELALLGIVLANRRQFMRDNNLLQVSSTTQILNDIIAEEDAPFIYERIGTYIDNYLIDEFQDTSRMQWDNFRPLLVESLSRGCDHLIIGDVKQSIYRFRNAEPNLLAYEVPNDNLDIAPEADGLTAKTSTNWRSAREIVQFNNSIFTLLANNLPENINAGADLPVLYGNVVQQISNKQLTGHVHIEIAYTPKGETPYGISQTPELIMDLLSRGYRQKDIAVLVGTHDEAAAVIDTIVAFNSNRAEGQIPINVISEQSLTVASSQAVQNIISVLELMRHPLRNEDRKRNVNLLISRYHYVRSKHPDISFDDIVQQHVDDEQIETDMYKVLSDMQALSLPSLVEAIAGYYLPEEMRVSHAAYIAALQDMVLDYCESKPADIASFLDWWHEYGVKHSISSPESTDAVNVMTVHKSKGLEFGCVILPKADWSFAPSDRDTLWVEPHLPHDVDTAGIPMPPYIAVKTGKHLIDSPYMLDYLKYRRETAVETLNSIYVAFTRAKRELYVFCERPQKVSESYMATIGYQLQTLLGAQPDVSAFPNPELHIDLRNWHVITDGECFEYGKPTSPLQEALDRGEKPKQQDATGGYVVKYHTHPDRKILHAVTDAVDADSFSNEATELGDILHQVMSRVRTQEDLRPSLLKEAVRGNLSRVDAERWYKLIYQGMRQPQVAEWFRPGLEVINERAIVFNNLAYRPDRVIVDDLDNATVIDYKFGDTENGKYHKQVKQYMSLLQSTGIYRNVSGYLWYVAQNKVVRL